MEKGKKLLVFLDQARRQKWIETMERLDMWKSFRSEAWSLLKRFEGKNTNKNIKMPIKIQSIAALLVANSKVTVKKEHNKNVKK